MSETCDNHGAFPPASAAGGHWLITSAAAKVDLTRRMRAALNAASLKLFATDCSPLAAAFHFADGHFLSLPANDPEYTAHLIAACRERDIRVILPTRDGELAFFATHQATLSAAGIWVLVSPLDTITNCLDKILFHQQCQRAGIPVLPRLENPGPADYPCFVRPRSGAGGRGAGCVTDAAELCARHGPPPWPDLLIQPLCRDPEYTIDAIFSPCGRPVQWVTRQRILTRAGESVITRTVSLPAIDALMPAIGSTFRLFGPVTLQAFCDGKSGPHLIEINPRFGGASALGIEAGLDTPARLVALVQGDKASFLRSRPVQTGLTMLRYSADVFVADNLGVIP